MINAFQNFKKNALLTLLFLFILMKTFAHKSACPNHNKLDFAEEFFCDLCGCSTSGGSFGQGTLNNASFIGARYIYQKFVSKDGIFDNSPTSTETFNTYQLWSRIPVSEKLYVSIILPYQDLKRNFTDRNEDISGLGDITMISWLKIPFYKKENTSENAAYTQVSKVKSGHSIEIGLGAKLPTGNFEQVLSDRVNPGFQLGTGSLDGILAFNYNYAADKFGVNSNLTYYIKGENKNEYRFGNQFSFASNFFYAIPKEKFNLMPFVGLSGNVYNKIEQFGEFIANTDGTVYNATIGSELLLKDFIFGANYTLPIKHNLFGGNVTPKQSFTLYVNYKLNNFF
jgi:hypothetical protein